MRGPTSAADNSAPKLRKSILRIAGKICAAIVALHLAVIGAPLRADAAKLDAALKQTTQSCAACHKAYRNEMKQPFSTMSFTPERCPLCGQPNECQSATQSDYKGPCWCMKENFPPELLARVPEEARRCACICQRCLAEAQRAEQAGA